MKDKSFIARGILAGVCISMGGCIFLKTGGVAGAILFAFGLIAVVSLGLNLFTGKARFVWGPAPDQSEQGGYAWLLAILILNIIGCMLMGLLMSDASMQAAAQTVIDKRLASSPLRNGILAIGCGFIMTLAVQGTDKGRWLPLLFGIPAFILCGFPHCIADAFYIASLPLDYITDHVADLSAFYCAIVAGNFLGCNAYRLTAQTSQHPASQPSNLPTFPTQMPLSVIKVFSSDAAANIALGVLRTNGIPAVLNNEIASGVFGIQLAPSDGIRLLVNEQDRDLALRLLDHPDARIDEE